MDAGKTAAISEMTEDFARDAVLTGYRGLTVAELGGLRSALRGDARFRVVKNTLANIAARQAGLGDLGLSGPTAVAFVHGDTAGAARSLRDFARTHPALVVKGGILGGDLVDAGTVGRLAGTEPRDVLLARFAGSARSAAGNAAVMFGALPAGAARLAEALRAKREGEK